MSFLYKVISPYAKSEDIRTDKGSSGTITTLKAYLDSIDEVCFDVITTYINEIITLNSIDHVSDEYIPYLAYLLGYTWNYNLDFDLQRNLLKNILELYKRKGTKFAFHFNIYQLDPTVELYEPYRDLFVLNKSKYGEAHLPSRDYYSYGVLVIRLNKFTSDILEMIEYVRPGGWKIILEFNYGIYYSFHIKVNSEERMALLNNCLPIDYDYSKYTTNIQNYQNILDTPGNIYSNVTSIAVRSNSTTTDSLNTYINTEYLVSVSSIYVSIDYPFVEGLDYNMTFSNKVISWTSIGQSKILPGTAYYIEYIKDVKKEAENGIKIDTSLHESLIANVNKDKYFYNEFGIVKSDRMSDEAYNIQFINSIQYVNGQFMPITMVGRTQLTGNYQHTKFVVNNETDRFNLINTVYWETKSLGNYEKITDNIFTYMYNYAAEFKIGNSVRFDNLIGEITDSEYSIDNNYTIVTVSFISSTSKIPDVIDNLYTQKYVVGRGDIICQEDTEEIYIVINNNKLDSADGYELQHRPLDIVYSLAEEKPTFLGTIRLRDIANHHILYETENELYTLYRLSIHYSTYQLVNGTVHVEDGSEIFVVPNGISEVVITTVGGGGGSSDMHYIAGNKMLAVGGGGGQVVFNYVLNVMPGDIIMLHGGSAGSLEADGGRSYIEIKRVIDESGTFEIIKETIALGGKAPEKLQSVINKTSKSGYFGVDWYGGEPGGYNGGSGGGIWSKNVSIHSLNTMILFDLLYSDYGNRGFNDGGKTLINTGVLCGGGGSLGLGAGENQKPGYGGGGCYAINNGHGGPGFAELKYDITKIVE